MAALSQTKHGKNQSGHQNNQRKVGDGRKRSLIKVEDKNLVKRLMMGEMGENVERNERQIKHLEELNQEICLNDTWYQSWKL